MNRCSVEGIWGRVIGKRECGNMNTYERVFQKEVINYKVIAKWSSEKKLSYGFYTGYNGRHKSEESEFLLLLYNKLWWQEEN